MLTETQFMTLFSDFIDSSMFRSLSIQDLARLEASNRSTRAASLSSSAWDEVAWHSLSAFEVSPAVLGASDVACKDDLARLQKRRQEFNAVVAALKHVVVAGLPLVPLPNVVAARGLSSAVCRANATAASHFESAGIAARVLTARVCFPEWVATAPDDDMFVSSKPVLFTMPGDGDDAEQKCADRTLRLRLAWDKDTMYVKVCGPESSFHFLRPGVSYSTGSSSPEDIDAFDDDEDDESYYDECDEDATARHLVVDIAALSSVPLVRTRGTVVSVGGGWRKARGLVSATAGPAVLAKTLAAGLTCVLCIRDVGAEGDEPAPSFYTHALNIDAPTRR